MNNLVRAFVLVLTVSGSIAYTQISNSAPTSKTAVAKSTTMLVPGCPLNDPNNCGLGSSKH